MALPIEAVSFPTADATSLKPASPTSGGPGFTEALSRMIESTGDAQNSANDSIGRMLDGTGDVHEAMIALQRAELSLQLTVQVRNKLVQAYQDIMKMPI